MFKNKLGEDLPISKCINLKIRRQDGVESLTNPEEGEFKVPIDGCIKGRSNWSKKFQLYFKKYNFLKMWS